MFNTTVHLCCKGFRTAREHAYITPGQPHCVRRQHFIDDSTKNYTLLLRSKPTILTRTRPFTPSCTYTIQMHPPTQLLKKRNAYSRIHTAVLVFGWVDQGLWQHQIWTRLVDQGLWQHQSSFQTSFPDWWTRDSGNTGIGHGWWTRDSGNTKARSNTHTRHQHLMNASARSCSLLLQIWLEILTPA